MINLAIPEAYQLLPKSLRKLLVHLFFVFGVPFLRFWCKRKPVQGKSGVVSDEIALPEKHVFFGYYDITPFSEDKRYILFHSVERHASPETHSAEILTYDRQTRKITLIGKTEAWCWQQGARLRWINQTTIAFNQKISSGYVCQYFDLIAKKVMRTIPIALYDISRCGKWGGSLNFERLQALRPGYGYSGVAKSSLDFAPEDDGLFLVDTETGTSNLLISLRELAAHNSLPSMDGANHYVNHISWSPDGEKLLFFHLWEKEGKRASRAFVFYPQTNKLVMLGNSCSVSHYAWSPSSDTVLMTAQEAAYGFGYFEYKLASPDQPKFLSLLPRFDGHPSYIKDLDRILTDSYPNKLLERSLFIISKTTGQQERILDIYSPYRYRGELRCDLHPRFSPNQEEIAIDTVHNGIRSMLLLNFKG